MLSKIGHAVTPSTLFGSKSPDVTPPPLSQKWRTARAHAHAVAALQTAARRSMTQAERAAFENARAQRAKTRAAAELRRTSLALQRASQKNVLGKTDDSHSIARLTQAFNVAQRAFNESATFDNELETYATPRPNDVTHTHTQPSLPAQGGGGQPCRLAGGTTGRSHHLRQAPLEHLDW